MTQAVDVTDVVHDVLMYLIPSRSDAPTVAQVVQSLCAYRTRLTIRQAIERADEAGLVHVIGPYLDDEPADRARIRITAEGLEAMKVGRRQVSAPEQMGALWRAGKYAHCPVCGTRSPRLPA